MTSRDNSTIDLTKKLFLLMERKRRYQFLILLILMIVTSMFEVISIGAVIPFLGVLIEPSNIFDLPAAQSFIQFLGVDQPTQIILPISALFAIAVLLSGAMRLLLLWTSIRYGFALGVDFSVGIFTQVINQPYIAHTKQNSSDIISAISIKIAQVINGVVLSVLNMISSFIIVTAIITILLIINPGASLIAIGFFSSLYLFYYLYVKQKLKENSLKISLESNSLIKILQEALGGIRDIIIDDNQEFYRNIYQRADLRFRKSAGNNNFIGQSPRYIMETFGVILIVFLAYMLSTQDEKSFADGIPVLGALALGAQRLLPVMQIMYNAWGNLKGTHFVLEEVLVFLNINDSKTMRGMGSGMEPRGLGFMLQDRGELFSLEEDHANVIEGGKRPFHTIIPAFVTKDNKPYLSFGVMGGATQPQAHAQIIINLIDFGYNLQEAGDAPRLVHSGSSQPTDEIMLDGGSLSLETGFGTAIEEALKEKGHKLQYQKGIFGGYQAIMIKDGVYFGASESRKDGQASGY